MKWRIALPVYPPPRSSQTESTHKRESPDSRFIPSHHFVTSLVCLSGEIVVNEVNFVKKCMSAENSQDDLWGKLICTNFKVSFIPQEDSSKQVTEPLFVL